jgi:hypothetical protein
VEIRRPPDLLREATTLDSASVSCRHNSSRPVQRRAETDPAGGDRRHSLPPPSPVTGNANPGERGLRGAWPPGCPGGHLPPLPGRHPAVATSSPPEKRHKRPPPCASSAPREPTACSDAAGDARIHWNVLDATALFLSLSASYWAFADADPFACWR